MVKPLDNFFGFLPSLEVLPLFGKGVCQSGSQGGLPFHAKAFSSYGGIARSLLTKDSIGGILPWEIFVSEVLSLPGQRNQWQVPMFVSACPTELVLREQVHRSLYSARGSKFAKFPRCLTLGVESQSSLTKHQFREWLAYWPQAASVKVSFRTLPMELMIHALKSEMIDAIIAPSPWGMRIEEDGIGKRDTRFTTGRHTQRLALAFQREFAEQNLEAVEMLPTAVASARRSLRYPSGFADAVSGMARSGSPGIAKDLLVRAAGLHGFSAVDDDMVTDAGSLAYELTRLREFELLPLHVSPGAQTARLLLDCR